jgi:hypothetical protein
MSDRFDLEQQILNCWNIIEDIKLLDKNVLEGKIEGGSLTHDEISNYLLGLETIYNMKFEQMFATFSDLIKTKQI